MFRTQLLFLFVTTAACVTEAQIKTDPSPSGELDPDFYTLLVQHHGCQDTWMQSWNDADTIGMELFMEGPLSQALPTGSLNATFSVEEEVGVIVEVGSSISNNYCGDEYADRQLTATYRAVSGWVRIFMSTEGPSIYDGGQGGFELMDVVFEDEHGHQVTVEQFEGPERRIDGSWGA